MALATLSIDLVAKLASFEADLKKAATAAETTSQRMAAAFGIARAGIAGLVGAISVGALTEFFQRTVRGVDALNDLADATGASVENLSALEDVALRTGTSMETAGDAVIKLNKALASAVPGSEQARAIEAIGLSAKDLKQLDPAEALRQVAVALSGFADDGNKARLVQELFGKSLKVVAPLLNDLATKSSLVGTVTTEAAKEAEKFGHELDNLAKNSLDAARNIVGPMVTAINKSIEAFRAGKVAGEAFFETLINQQLKALGVDVDTRNLRQAKVELEGLDALLEKGVMSDQRRIALQEKRTLLADKLYRIEAKAALENAAFRPSQNYGDAFKPTLPDVKVDPNIDKARTAYLKLAESIGLATTAASEEIATGEKLTPLQTLRNKVLQELSSGEVKFSQAQKASIGAALDGLVVLDKDLSLRQLQLEVQKQSAKLTDQQVTAIERESAARLQGNESLRNQVEEYGKTAEVIERLRIARLEDVAAQEQVNILALQNVEGTEQEVAARQLNIDALRTQIGLRKTLAAQDQAAATDAAGGAQRALDDYLLTASRAGVATQEAVSRSIGTLENDLTTSFAKGKIDVRSFVDTVIQEMIRLQVVRPLLKSIFGGESGLGGGLMSLLGGLLGGGGGGGGLNYGGQFDGFRAAGGPVLGGNAYVVGERGPEVIVPQSSGTVVPNSALGGSQYIVNVQGDASENTLRLVQGALAQFEARMMRRG